MGGARPREVQFPVGATPLHRHGRAPDQVRGRLWPGNPSA